MASASFGFLIAAAPNVNGLPPVFRDLAKQSATPLDGFSLYGKYWANRLKPTWIGRAMKYPSSIDDFKVLIEALSTLGEGGVKAIVGVRKGAAPHPELHPALTDMVQRGDVFGDMDRVGQG